MYFCPGEMFLAVFFIEIWPFSGYPSLESSTSTDMSLVSSLTGDVVIRILEKRLISFAADFTFFRSSLAYDFNSKVTSSCNS